MKTQEPNDNRNHLSVCGGVLSKVQHFGPIIEGVRPLAQTQLILATQWRMAKSLCFSREARSPDFSVKSDF